MLGIVFPASSFASSNGYQAAGNFSVPVSAGKVTSAGYYGSGDIIINIQDLHCHGEAQRRIADILSVLDEKYAINRVYLEGAFGSVDTGWISEFKNSELGRGAMESLVDSGYLSGTEYYSAIKDKKDFIAGIEDEEIYKNNVKLLSEIIKLRPEVHEIVTQLKRDMKDVKKEYSNKEARHFDRLIKAFEKNSISAQKYYTELMKIAANHGIDAGKYPNIRAYSELSKMSPNLDIKKASQQLQIFVNVLKEKMPYKDFSALSSKSGNFSKLDDLSAELIALSDKYQICESNKLGTLKEFFAYLDFNGKVNPMEFVNEEKNLRENIFLRLADNKYEREVSFLAGFIPRIEGYFSASITSDDLASFEADFKKFKETWCSYFPENTAKKLDIYAEKLSQYHAYNLKRDEIFAKTVCGGAGSGKASAVTGNAALAEIGREINGRNVKIVVTGGFHSRGLEKLFNDKKISYVIITPKVTKNTLESESIYDGIITEYGDILKNTINVEPLTQEPLYLSFPKVIAGAYEFLSATQLSEFQNLSIEDKKEQLRVFAENVLRERGNGKESISDLKIESYSAKELVFSLTIKNKNGKEKISRHAVRDGKLLSFDENNNIKSVYDTKTRIVRYNFKSLPYAFADVFKTAFFSSRNIFRAFIMPVAEEFLFRWLPFAGTALLIGNPVSFVPFAITAVAGIGIFAIAHIIADNAAIKANPLAQRRSASRIFWSSAILTGAFLAVTFAFPGSALLAAAATSLMHIQNNMLSMSGIIKNPVLNVAGAALNNPESPEDDNFVIAANLQKMHKDLEAVKNGYEYRRFMNDKNKNMLQRCEDILSEFKNADAPEAAVDFALKLYDFMRANKNVDNYIDDKSAYMIIGIILKQNMRDERVFAKSEDIFYALVPAVASRAGVSVWNPFSEESMRVEEEARRNTSNILSPFAAQVYRRNKKLGLEMLKELNKVVASNGGNDVRLLELPAVASGIKDARAKLPNGWSEVLSDADIIKFYEEIGTFVIPELESKADDAVVIEKYITSLDKLRKDAIENKELSVEAGLIIRFLFEKAETKSLNTELRIKIAAALGKAASQSVFYNISDMKQFLSPDILNPLFKKLNMDMELVDTYPYIKESAFVNAQDVRGIAMDRFDYTRYINFLPKNILSGEALSSKTPILITITGKTKEHIDMGGKLKKLSETNTAVLAKYRSVNEDSSEDDKKELFELIDNMCLVLKEINEHDAVKASAVSEKMKNGEIPASDMFRSELDGAGTADFENITSIHALINAVHQTGIRDAQARIKDFSSGKSGQIRNISVTRNNDSISVNDLSVSEKVNADVLEFLEKLAFSGINISGRVVLDGDIIVWSVLFSAHSADIIFNFDRRNKEISVSFQESDDRIGNYRRMQYFANVLKPMGFETSIVKDSGFYPMLRARLSKDSGLTSSADFISIASKTIELFQYSTNLDFSLEGGLLDPAAAIDKLAEKFNAGEIRYGYNPLGYVDAYSNSGIGIFARIPNLTFAQAGETLNRILEYLGLEKIPQEISGKNLEQSLLDKYFNDPIKRAYIVGKIVIGSDGNLIPSGKYALAETIVDEINGGFKDLSIQSQLVNFVDYDLLNLRAEDYGIGGFSGTSGYLKVDEGYISISGLMNKTTRRLELARTELVDLNGVRKRLGNKELKDILSRNGFYAVKPLPKNAEELIAMLDRLSDSGESDRESIKIQSFGIASPDGKFSAGFAAYNIKKSKEDSVVIAPYITPSNIEDIRGSALIVTSGGANSHANVVAGERGKSVSLMRADWEKGTMNAESYSFTGEIENYKGFAIQMRRPEKISVKDGEALLVNGETGEVLIFRAADGTNAVFRDLYGFIKNKDAASVKRIISENKDSADIGKIIEYVYLSAIGKAGYTDILFMLMDLRNEGGRPADKIDKLNREYALSLYYEISRKIEEIENITNIITVQYTQVIKLENDVKLLNLISADDDKTIKIAADFGVLKKNLLNKFCKYVDEYSNKANYLLNSGSLHTTEVEDAIKYVKIAKYWNNFYGYPGIEELVSKLEDKISQERLRRLKAGRNETSVPFENIYTFDESEFGSKTIGVAKYYKIIKSLGFDYVRVPHGFGLSSLALHEFFDESGARAEFDRLFNFYKEQIAAYAKETNEAEKEKIAASVKNAAAKMIELISSNDSQALKDKIKEMLKGASPNTRYAVRTSGVGEDSIENTFAGIGESELNVSAESIYDSVKNCWISFLMERGVDYVLQMKNPSPVEPAVLVQTMASEKVSKSGAFITRNRVGNMTMEGVYGLSAKMMEGTMTPDRVIIHPTGAVQYVRNTGGSSGKKLVNVAEGGTRLVDLSDEERISRVLWGSSINRLKNIAYKIEQLEGYPVECEFVEEEGSGIISIVQIRPAKTYVAAGYDISRDIQSNIVLMAESAGSKPLFTQVSWSDNPVPIYLKEASEDMIVFSTLPKYADLINDEQFQLALYNKLQDDRVIKKLPPFAAARLKYKALNIVPGYFDSKSLIRDAVKDAEIGLMSRLLAAS
ncbi:MAG: PEP/pyruvate-binding domain-containing protein [Endomicrobia bacterium]|nr:PEP/pyruvate-binding domain-containing protein [Endomicrobiia bacterium]